MGEKFTVMLHGCRTNGLVGNFRNILSCIQDSAKVMHQHRHWCVLWWLGCYGILGVHRPPELAMTLDAASLAMGSLAAWQPGWKQALVVWCLVAYLASRWQLKSYIPELSLPKMHWQTFCFFEGAVVGRPPKTVSRPE